MKEKVIQFFRQLFSKENEELKIMDTIKHSPKESVKEEIIMGEHGAIVLNKKEK